MLDLITLFSTLGVQSELNQVRQRNPESSILRSATRETESGNNFFEDTAEQLGSAIQVVDGMMAKGMESLFGEPEAQEPVSKPASASKKKVV